MTPNDIEVLLHYHCMAVIHPRLDAPAVQQAVENFKRHGIMVIDFQDGSGYSLTAKGRALVTMLCNTPFPVSVAAHTDPRTDELINHD